MTNCTTERTPRRNYRVTICLLTSVRQTPPPSLTASIPKATDPFGFDVMTAETGRSFLLTQAGHYGGITVPTIMTAVVDRCPG